MMSAEIKRRVVFPILLVGLVAVVAVSLAACNPLTVIFEPTPAPTATALPVPLPPHKTIVFCDDETPSYPAYLFHSAAGHAARWVYGLVHPNEGGATVYVQWINEDSFSISSTAFIIIVPPLGPAPVPPPPVPTPGVFGAREAATATAETASAQATFAAVSAQYTAQLKEAQAYVRAPTDKLRALVRTERAPSDIWGCPQRASTRFEGAKGDQKYLVIASDMEIVGPQQVLSPRLDGVNVTVINFKCYEVSICAADTNYWTDAMRRAHASSVTFLDPGQTSAVDELFA